MNNILFDTHSHIDLLKDFDETIVKIEDKKIYTIAVTNLPPLYTKLNSRLNSKYIKPALGFHPELIEQYQKYIPEMWDLLPKAKYIGEIGLDFKIASNSKKLQINFFEELIFRCNDLGKKILTIHSRGSADEVVSIIGDRFNGKYILHWYSGRIITMNKAILNGAYFSVNYAMFNSESGKKIIKNIPDNRLLIESDAPFIKLNKNKYFNTTDIEKIIIKLAEIRNISIDDMSIILSNNFKNILVNRDE